MKKLMIAATIVCVAALSQAASFTWVSGAKVYVNNSDPATWKNGDVITALTSGTKGYADGLSGFTWAFEMVLTDGTSSDTLTGTPIFGSHRINNTLSSDVFELPTDESTKTYTWDIVITGTGRVGDQDVTLTSNTIHGSFDYTKLSDTKLTFAAPSTWTVTIPSDVPEPTSGLLLLLGVAGLALRRKQK